MSQITQKNQGVFRELLRAGMRFTKRFSPTAPTVRQTKFNGFNLVVWANEYIGHRLLTVGSFEPDEIRLFPTFVRPGDNCVDVGANIGLHTTNLARAVGPTGRIFAFEPVKKNALMVQLNCELNGFANVTVEAMPLSDKGGKTLGATLPEGDSAYAFFAETPEGTPSVTLDEYLVARGIQAVHFVKIDVEGAEMMVLRGARQLLSSHGRPHTVVVEVVTEYLARFSDTTTELMAVMQGHGYVAHCLRQGNLVPVTVNDVSAENVYFIQSGAKT